MTLRDPNNDSYPLVIAAADPVPGVLSIPFPLQGNWTYTTSNVQPVTQSKFYVNATNIEGNKIWTFVVKEEGSGTLPSGTRLTLRLPSVMSNVDGTPANQSGWKNITARDDLDRGAEVTAELDGALSNGTRNLTVQARRPSNGDALYHLTASLDQGASAKASFVLAGTTGVVTTSNPIDHELYLSVPKPQAPSTNATWGLAFPFPRTVPGAPETVQRLDLRSADGTPVFANITGISPASGWEWVSSTHVRWTGAWSLAANRVMGFALKVQAPAQRTPDEPGISLPVQFLGNTHQGAPPSTNFTMEEQERPYVHAFNVPPPRSALGQEQKGYHRPTGAPQERSNTSFNATGIVRGMLASGTATYGVTAWGGVTALAEATRNGLGKSHLNMSTSAVKIGDFVSIEVDYQGLFVDLGLYPGTPISGWSVELSIFDPAQPYVPYAEMLPSYNGRWGANGSLDPPGVYTPADGAIYAMNTVNSTILTVAHGYLNFTIPQGMFYGPHLIVAQANFVVNDAVGNSMVQTVRQIGAMEIVPDSGQSTTALYWATLECWLPDW